MCLCGNHWYILITNTGNRSCTSNQINVIHNYRKCISIAGEKYRYLRPIKKSLKPYKVCAILGMTQSTYWLRLWETYVLTGNNSDNNNNEDWELTKYKLFFFPNKKSTNFTTWFILKTIVLTQLKKEKMADTKHTNTKQKILNI